MPKLYYTPTSCGAASFIAAYSAGVKLDCETVDISTHKTASGADYYAVNPLGAWPGEGRRVGGSCIVFLARHRALRPIPRRPVPRVPM